MTDLKAPLIMLAIGAVAAALPMEMRARALQEELDMANAIESSASEAWTDCSMELSREYEYRKDEVLERTVREQVESVFWPCGRDPLPDGYCEKGAPNPRDVLDHENYNLHPDSCTADCKYCALEKAVGDGT